MLLLLFSLEIVTIVLIDLSHNTIPLLTKNFDNGLGKLEWLSLRGNLINEIHANTLSNLTHLRHLDLSRNDLRKLAKGVLHPPMTRLEWFDLSDNKLAQMNVAEIMDMKALELLDLRRNRLTTIDPMLFGRIKTGMLFYFQGEKSRSH